MFRFYDAKTGKYISKDPIGFMSGDTNLYRYVFNSPVNFVDPFGLAHEGFVIKLAQMANKSLLRTIKSLTKRIQKHEKALTDECQKLAKKHHEHEIKVMNEQLKLAEQEALKRGLMGAGIGGSGVFAEDITEEEAEKRTSSFFDWIDPFILPGKAY